MAAPQQWGSLTAAESLFSWALFQKAGLVQTLSKYTLS